ncbi:LuxR C-terminal-related transcriptional regulator [Kribbella sp. NPDC003505]|uniref:helix-turn-helix transcriptional regulator n=1 Tax=Kribbella sp. NPDC003505 TaxID=3154448 RepID=UPI0033A2DEAC
MFESLGLTDDEVAVYRALLRRPELVRPSELAELATEVNMSEEQASVRLGRLREMGLLVPRWNIAGEEYPLHPATGFELLADRRQREIDKLAEELNSSKAAGSRFVSDYSEFLIQRQAGEVEILHGERAYQRMQVFQPTKSMWAMFPPYAPQEMPRDPEDSPDTVHLKRGIDARYLVVESQVKTRGAREYLDYVAGYGAKSRVVPSVPLKMIIFDGEAVVVGIDPDNTSVGAMIHHSKSILRIVIDLYERYWRDARPLVEPALPGPAVLSAQETEFLRLLVEGATDEQAARKLGISMRTVRRIAAKLSEQVGASGRFELGVRAAQRGWVD